jgi:D-glycero-beta-D-manno-heptose 1-phosphate adenylyltransferase
MPSFFEQIQSKIQSREQACRMVRHWQDQGAEIVFTNGCFDLLHYGHIHYLAEARNLGDRLVVGVNSGQSVSRLKGPHRPINDELTRLHNLAAMVMVDLVVVFGEETPLALIEELCPDILVKGGDWPVSAIVGAEAVMARGGRVYSLPFIAGYSTTAIESKIKSGHDGGQD